VTENKLTAFQKRCIFVADFCYLPEPSFYEDRRKSEAHHDDGTLHVIWRGQRACFDVSNCQDDPEHVVNEKTRKVLIGIGLEKFIGDRVLVEEDDDEDDRGDCCPHCGR